MHHRQAYLTKLLGVYRAFNVKLLALRGLTPQGAAEKRVVSGEAWSDFCDALKAAGATLVA